MKRVISLILVLALGLCTISACGKGESGEVSAKGVKMYMVVSVSDTFREDLMLAAKAKAESMGAEITLDDSGMSLETQMSQIKKAVEDGYDAILCNPVDVDTTLQLQLAAGDLPIIFWNSCPDDSYLEKDKYVFVGSNEEVAGKYQAEYILDKFAAKDSINVAIIEGQKMHPTAVDRSHALRNALNNSGKQINYVFDDNAEDWGTETAKSQFDVFLKTRQTADVVACNNDAMALGVIQSCEEHNISLDTTSVIGVDATAEGCEAIEAGKMQFTALQPAVGQGEYAVMAAARLAKGKSLDGLKYLDETGQHVWVPFEKVDAGNVAEYH